MYPGLKLSPSFLGHSEVDAEMPGRIALESYHS